MHSPICRAGEDAWALPGVSVDNFGAPVRRARQPGIALRVHGWLAGRLAERAIASFERLTPRQLDRIGRPRP